MRPKRPSSRFYRESPQPLDARPFGLVTALNPPPFTAGMATVVLDGNGRLVDFSAVPYDAGSATVPPETVFRAAGLDMAAFTETAPENLPTHPFDQRHAWKGPHPKIPQTELLVEIASWKGQITRATVSIRRPKDRQRRGGGRFEPRADYRDLDIDVRRRLLRAAAGAAELEAAPHRHAGRVARGRGALHPGGRRVGRAGASRDRRRVLRTHCGAARATG